MKIIRLLLVLLIVLSAVAFIFPFDVFEIDVIQSFAFHAMLFYLFAALVFLIWHKWMLASSSFSAGVIILLFLSPHLISEESYNSYRVDGNTFKVAHFNVLCKNTRYKKTIDQALASGSDLLSFQEVDARWFSQLAAGLQELYPYCKYVPGNPHGLAVFSRYPFSNLKIYVWAGVPNLAGNIVFQDTEVHFLATHTLSPRTTERYEKRNGHLKKVAQYLKERRGPVLAIGDFNAVPWNPYIVEMKEQSRMTDSRNGMTPTYPSNLKLGGIPIDYIFHSDELRCLGFRAVETAGSDHRGIVGVYQLKGKAAEFIMGAHEQQQKAGIVEAEV